MNNEDTNVEVPAKYTLAELLREKLDLTGTKLGCNRAECGVCTVLLDGKPVFSCSLLAIDVNERKVETIEGLAQRSIFSSISSSPLHSLQQEFVKDDALQCGFCTPGLLMSLKALLDKVPHPTAEEARQAIAGNYCRCGAYPNVIEAALKAAAASSTRSAFEGG